MDGADFSEQPCLLVARGHIASPRGEAFATRRRGGGAPGSVRASRIDFSLPVIDTTARRGCAREQRKISRPCRGNCGDFVDTVVTAHDGMQRKGTQRSPSLPAKGRESWTLSLSPAKQRFLGIAGRGNHRLVGPLVSQRLDGWAKAMPPFRQHFSHALKAPPVARLAGAATSLGTLRYANVEARAASLVAC